MVVESSGTPAPAAVDEGMAWREDGYFVRRRFAGPEIGERMLARVIAIAARRRGEDVRPAVPVLEAKPASEITLPEQRVSKVFGLHRDPAFEAFARDPGVLDLVATVLGADIDCFLSQFIFKMPGAYGQPWHQDSYYFRFDRGPQVGVWLAVTEATPENGCLWVLPGSHTEPVHEHEPDDRPDSQYGYVTIVDHDFAGAVPVLLQPGDLLVFHSHLMHRSTDNVSGGFRAAMVYHYSPAGTVDHSPSSWANVNDWMPVRRA